MNTIKVTYRDIAKMLVKAMPVEGEEFGNKVNEYIESIRALPSEAKIALRAAYIFSAKVPREEREDMFQELALAILKTKATDERLAYSVARCDWMNWWRDYKLHSQYYSGSLNRTIEDNQGGVIEFGELLVGEIDFERRINGDLDGKALFDRLPSWIRAIVEKRIIGKSITGGEKLLLNKWVASRPMILAEYQA